MVRDGRGGDGQLVNVDNEVRHFVFMHSISTQKSTRRSCSVAC